MKIKVGDQTRAIGYLRVSTDEQHLGPEAQRDALGKWATANGVTLVAIYTEAVSGGAELDERTQLLAAIDAIKEHGAGVLLVAKRDRLARDTMLAAMIERLVERAGGRVVSADGVGNGTGPEAQLMRGIIDLFAQYERALIRTRTVAAMAMKKGRGERVGKIPFGLMVGADGKTLVPHPVEQEAVQLIVSMRGHGVTLKGITDRLNADGVACRGGRWHVTSVVRVLDRVAA
jgi:DNA invertase Pin-like site-specific DNA recombinase